MTRTLTIAIATLLASAAMTGCGTAQLVRQDPGAGQVNLEGAYMPAMGEARVLMAEYCGGRFDLTEEGDQLSFRCRAGQGGQDVAQVAAGHGRGL